MICPFCNEENSGNSKFCTKCGKKLMKTEVAVVPKKKTWIWAVTALLIVAVIGIAVFLLSRNPSNDYIILYNNTFKLANHLSGDSAEVLGSGANDIYRSNADSIVQFSKDGKYGYYFTDYDSSSDTGVLYQVELKKLRNSFADSDDYRKKVAVGVRSGFYPLEGGVVVYEQSGQGLYIFDNGDNKRIAENIAWYKVDENNNIIYLTQNTSDSYSLFSVNIQNIDRANEIAGNIYDFSEIGGKEYFTVENGSKVRLSDFVNDSYQKSDAALKEPNEEDYSIPVYGYIGLTGNNLSESDYEDLYTSSSQPLYWFGTWGGALFSMNDNMKNILAHVGDEVYSPIGFREGISDDVYEKLESFINNYSKLENEDGYILVTDEIKSALKDISKCDKYYEEWKWLWLCNKRVQSGTETDEEAYNAAVEEWNEAQVRNEVRDYLNDTEYSTKTLYCYDGNTRKTIDEDVLLTYITADGSVLYATSDMVSDKVDITELYTEMSSESVINLANKKGYNIVLADGSVAGLKNKNAMPSAEADEGKAEIYVGNNEIFLSYPDGRLEVANNKNGSIGDSKEISENAVVLLYKEETLYYEVESVQNTAADQMDLYAYKNGESTCLAKGIINDESSLYSDGMILAYTGYGNGSSYELSLYEKDGEKKVIDQNVTEYLRVDESTILYISGGTLYSYNGNSKQLRDDTSYIWSREKMENILAQ